VRVFAFVNRQKAEFAVKTLCRVCRVSASGYYDWAARQAAGPTPAERAETELIDQIRLVHKESRRRDLRMDHLVQHDEAPQRPRLPTAYRVQRHLSEQLLAA